MTPQKKETEASKEVTRKGMCVNKQSVVTSAATRHYYCLLVRPQVLIEATGPNIPRFDSSWFVAVVAIDLLNSGLCVQDGRRNG